MNHSSYTSTESLKNTLERPFDSTFDLQLVLQVCLVLIWIVASCGGLAALAIYANSPGSPQTVPSQWPGDTELRLSEEGTTLILFAHPKCPCTRASLGELEKIVAKSQGLLTPWVVFFKPVEADDSWVQTDLISTAAAIPGTHVLIDVGGVESRRFHAATSGETLLYNNRGELLFNGGITLARGHAGDNSGSSAILSTTKGAAPLCRQTPTFGCPIQNIPQPVEEIP